uniref:protein FAR1-RELATED SEQUENCE 11-like n=1 Tax=Erigeron canadensis TaxID=72917 RepID=UPI001CB8A3B2|nr:protein FAR1-RELATED SEQUENCE 11-like [Erigeron canadensis]
MFDLNNLPDDEYDENIIDETLNNEPFIGQTFSTFQEAFVFYENCAKQYGFTVRKDRSHKRNDTTVRRDICCHREGKKRLKLVDISKNQRNRGSIKYVHNLFARVRRALGDNDAMELINYMEASKEKNNKFHYEYTIDEDMRLENIFWCHPQSFDWYEKFGDVIVFNTTYKVNAYDMPCALFVGINNHGKTVLFASALLRNETVKTFTWLMKTFVAIMKKPSKTIITDQDPWMTEAIATEMPTTKHSFCIWHITTKFSCWFAALLRTQYQNWCGDFYTLYKMTSIEEFEHSWPLIVSKYNLQKNNHVQGLYKFRKSWALAQVDLAVEEIGIREAKDKMSTTLTHVPLKTKSPSKEQAYGILTPFAFNKFQVEFQRANQYSIVRVEGNDFIIRYFDGENHKNHQVFWDGHITLCSCKNFEFWGILCRHIFRALLHKDCFKIPPIYFPLRWSLDSFQSGSARQPLSPNVSLTQTSIAQGIDLEKRYNVLCPPKSATKGRPKKRRMKGGKELGNKPRNRCSICKELGHTKIKCDNKENNVAVENLSSNKPQNKRKEMASDLGLNPVFSLKY